jgi:hypothetical protein
MAVNSGDSITAAQYNGLQSRINQVLGVGSGGFGYGQAVSSSQVLSLTDPDIPDGDSVTAAQFNNVRTDLRKAFIHQNGSEISISSFNVGDIIGADTSGTDINFTNGSVIVNPDASKGFNDLLDVMSGLEANRFQIDPGQAEIQVRAADERTSNFNGTITSEFTVSFSNANARRHFFNAGGQIRISGIANTSNSSPASLERDEGWSNLLTNPVEIHFDHNSTTVTGSSSGVSFPAGVIGNSDLTSSYQTIFRKDASAGVYGDSFWRIDARQDSTTQIRFRVVLVDDGPESDPDSGEDGSIPGGITEPVTATIEFEYAARRANGEVVVPFPAFNVVNTFE